MKRYSFWIFLGLLSGFLWGVNNVLYAAGYTAGMATGSRTFVDAALLFPLACTAVNDSSAAAALLIAHGRSGKWHHMTQQLRKKGSRYLCLAALLGGPVGQFTYCLGIIWAGAAYALAFSALYPVVGCLLAAWFLHQRITMRMWIGIVLAVGGAVLTGFEPPEGVPATLPLGIATACTAAVCWGSEIVLAVKGMECDISPESAITLRECISGSVLMLLVLLVLPGQPVMAELISKPEVLKFFVLAGVSAGVSYFLWYAVNHTIGCARGMAANTTYVIWGVLLQVFFTEIGITPAILVGCVLVFWGVVLVSWE